MSHWKVLPMTSMKWRNYCLVLPSVADNNLLLPDTSGFPWRTWCEPKEWQACVWAHIWERRPQGWSLASSTRPGTRDFRSTFGALLNLSPGYFLAARCYFRTNHAAPLDIGMREWAATEGNNPHAQPTKRQEAKTLTSQAWLIAVSLQGSVISDIERIVLVH